MTTDRLHPNLEVSDLDVSLGKQRILHQMSFTAHPGEILGVVGPNGAGKSTLLHALSGSLRYRGSIRIDGLELSQITARNRASALTFVAQDTAAAIELTTEQVVLLGAEANPNPVIPSSATDRAEAAIERTGITQLRNTRLSQLSGGQKQLVHLARALAQDTPIIILDEPLSALDINYQSRVLDQLRRAATAGKTILLTVHDLGSAAHICDRLALITAGKLTQIGHPRQVLTTESVSRSYGISVRVFTDPTSGRIRLLSNTSNTRTTTLGLEFAQW